MTRYFGKWAGAPVDKRPSYKCLGIGLRQRSTPSFVKDVQMDLVRTLGEYQSPEAVCDCLRTHTSKLERREVDPARLVVKNRISKPVDEYKQSTKNVAAFKRAVNFGLEKNPGQDVEYVVVDSAKVGQARVSLLHENPESYDVEFYGEQLV